MNRIFRRQRRLYLFAGTVGTVAIINVLFFLILFHPARSEYSRLQDSIARLRVETVARQRQVDLKERTGTQLTTSSKDRQELFTKHFIPLKVAYARVLPELDALAQRAGVRWSRRDYTIDPVPQYGLYSVKIKYPVQGGYSNIVNFIKALERTATFYIITSIDVRSGDNAFQPTAGNLALSLNLETFFYQ